MMKITKIVLALLIITFSFSFGQRNISISNGYNAKADFGTNGNGGFMTLKNNNGDVSAIIRSYEVEGIQAYFLSGNVGIGTLNPIYKLTVDGINNATLFKTSTNLSRAEADFGSNEYGSFLTLKDKNRNVSGIIRSYAIDDTQAYFLAGNVGIGTSKPVSKLSVNGIITAKDLNVKTKWPDFVFNEDYNLLLLSELEALIDKNKHLPGIPSAQEVEENGVNLGELSAQLLKKIEELTLYIIDQEKKIKLLETQLNQHSK